MTVVACKLKLHLPMSNSLKAKRQVVRSIVGQVRSRFDVAVAEVGAQDLWQITEIGVACVTSDVSHGHEVISKVASFVAGLKLGEAELLDYETEVAELF
ncbi:MAG TPA: DUF503 domain-containing protein [Chloroflexota bacterium]|nr:DUF503 domain-containing protein [Chloroflexota bacterium]